ncbi:DUF3768 domain-containing protein [Microvirga pudoricolor]|uniref:DUF3768 domain-containing protein n=1 Tax=Microvirga pudoricolor TaxID=2778729 RepID=UPI00194ECCDC|nr:DUF3768 domain-containing protein [Microvirga pudoricolor]MBM6593097.1 DUF3768 domain-containing protein [Microvirga pudoricolor]
MAQTTSPTDTHVRDLNDKVRQHRIGGRVVLTRGLAALNPALIAKIDRAVRAFDAPTPDNDPYNEHDFGSLTVEGYVVMFKIDAYDLDLQYASPDPRDPDVICRVLTLMLAEEY